MILSCIAAVAENNVIGKNNALPWRLSEDLQRFKKLTVGHALIMGRKTFESIGRPLPDRTTIVLTRNAAWEAPGTVVAHSLDEAIYCARQTEQAVEGPREAFVIGGEEVFHEALPLCARLYLTRVRAKVRGDALFPEVDPAQWRPLRRTSRPADEKNDHSTTFVLYERIQPKLVKGNDGNTGERYSGSP